MWHVCKDSRDKSPSDKDVQRCHQEAEEEANSGKATRANKKDLVLKVGGKPIKIVEKFNCLGRVIAKNDDDEEAVNQNLGPGRGNGRACGGSSFNMMCHMDNNGMT
jgi:hypothetical protein